MPFFSTEARSARFKSIVFFAALMAIVVLVGVLSALSYERFHREAETTASNLAEIVRQNIEETLTRAESDIRGFARVLKPEDLARGMTERRRAEIESLMSLHLLQFPQVSNYRVFTADGETVLGAGTTPATFNVAERTWFLSLKDDPTRELVLSEVLLGKGVKVPTVIVAVPVRDSGGQFLGAVDAVLDLSYFQRLIDAPEVGSKGLITVRRKDTSQLVLRRPAIAGKFNETVSTPFTARYTAAEPFGVSDFVSALDQVRRTTAFRQFRNYPLVVLVGLAHDDYLRPWIVQTLVAGLATLVFALLLATLFFIQERAQSALRAARVEARRQAHGYEALLRAAGEGICGVDAGGRVTFINSVARRVLALEDDEGVGTDFLSFTCKRADAADSSREGSPIYKALTDTQVGDDFLMHHFDDEIFWRKDGTQIPVECTVSTIGENRRIDGAVIIFRDITERKRAEADLRIAAITFEAQEGMTVTDAAGLILRVNKAFTEITGYTAEDVVGHTPRLLNSGRHDSLFYAAMWERINRTGSWQGEIWNRRKNGETYPEWLSITAVKGNDGIVTHYVGTFTDITLRKAAADEIEHLAFYDPLTDLPNRRLMLDRLAQALTSSARHGGQGALMLIDLDNFKSLNDTLGHAVGDQLLVETASRLRSSIREGDTVARLGGDEFVVILEDLDASEQAAVRAEGVATKILARLSQAYLLDVTLEGEGPGKRSHHCTSSIGLTLFSGHAVTVDELMKRADTAMYQAKAAGRNTLRFFDPAMQAVVKARAALELDLRKAIVERQFVLHYQAQVDASGRVIGSEALVRWQHPARGLVSPAEFIPLAEETGLILPLGHWVMEAACAQLAAWSARPETAHLTLAVNVSARQFSLPNLVEQVLAVMDSSGAPPDRLKLELTESLLLDNAEDVITKMVALKARGVGFALDDFGTGYSSLSYLKRLPLDQLKIDQSFVRDILTDTNDAAIARTVVALAESLGLSVIAEGVETQGQRDFLASSGCHAYQGYLFSRPLPVDAFEDLVARVRLLPA